MPATQQVDDLNEKEYKKDLYRRRRQHLDFINIHKNLNWSPCLHEQCPSCHGTGIGIDGGPCVHMISCPCPKCTPRC